MSRLILSIWSAGLVLFAIGVNLSPREAAAQVLAQIQTPSPGTTLTSSTVTFNWTSGEGVSQYWLWVSTVEGDGNLYSQSQGTSLSGTVTGLPTNVRLFVRLWSLVGADWLFIDYQYGPGAPSSTPTVTNTPTSTASTTPTVTGTLTSTPTSTWTPSPTSTPSVVLAQIQSPAPGSTLASSTVTFTWTSGLGVSQYWLWVSTVQGDGNLYSQSQGMSLSGTVSGVPTTQRVFVRLWSLIGTEWLHIDYQYGPGAVTSTPAPTFTPGGAVTPTNTRTPTNTPSPTATGTLTPTSTPSPTGAPSGVLAQIQSPAPGTTLTSSTVTFTWTSGTGVSQYWLWVSTVQGDGNLYSQSQGTSLSGTVTGLPTNVRLHVRLWSLIGADWLFIDYQYGPGAPSSTPTVTNTPTSTATLTPTLTGTLTSTPTATWTPSPTSTPSVQLAQIQSPAPGSTLASSTVTFTWTSGLSVSQYWLWVSTMQGDGNLYSQSQGTSLSRAVTGVPTNTRVFVRLWSLVGAQWHFIDYQYGAGAVTSTPAPTFTPGTGAAASFSILGPVPMSASPQAQAPTPSAASTSTATPTRTPTRASTRTAVTAG